MKERLVIGSIGNDFTYTVEPILNPSCIIHSPCYAFCSLTYSCSLCGAKDEKVYFKNFVAYSSYTNHTKLNHTCLTQSKD